jgi:hypothetical protein
MRVLPAQLTPDVATEKNLDRHVVYEHQASSTEKN